MYAALGCDDPVRKPISDIHVCGDTPRTTMRRELTLEKEEEGVTLTGCQGYLG
jgi:hypothetical protein